LSFLEGIVWNNHGKTDGGAVHHPSGPGITRLLLRPSTAGNRENFAIPIPTDVHIRVEYRALIDLIYLNSRNCSTEPCHHFILCFWALNSILLYLIFTWNFLGIDKNLHLFLYCHTLLISYYPINLNILFTPAALKA
jgi:hypothetical protein